MTDGRTDTRQFRKRCSEDYASSVNIIFYVVAVALGIRRTVGFFTVGSRDTHSPSARHVDRQRSIRRCINIYRRNSRQSGDSSFVHST